MNQPDYERFQTPEFEALRQSFPDVKNCGGCVLTQLAKRATDMDFSRASKRDLVRFIKEIGEEA